MQPQWPYADPRMAPWLWQAGLGSVATGGQPPFWPWMAGNDMRSLVWQSDSGLAQRPMPGLVLQSDALGGGRSQATGVRVVELAERRLPELAAAAEVPPQAATVVAAREQKSALVAEQAGPKAAAPKAAVAAAPAAAVAHAEAPKKAAEAPKAKPAAVVAKEVPARQSQAGKLGADKGAVTQKQALAKSKKGKEEVPPAPAPPKTCGHRKVQEIEVALSSSSGSSSSEYESEEESPPKKAAASSKAGRAKEKATAVEPARRADTRAKTAPGKESARCQSPRRKRNGEPKPDTSHPLWKGYKRMSRSKARAIRERHDRRAEEEVQRRMRAEEREHEQQRPATRHLDIRSAARRGRSLQTPPKGQRQRSASHSRERNCRSRRSSARSRSARRSRSDRRHDVAQRRRSRSRSQKNAEQQRQQTRAWTSESQSRWSQQRGWNWQKSGTSDWRSGQWKQPWTPATGANLVAKGQGLSVKAASERPASSCGDQLDQQEQAAEEGPQRYRDGLSKNQKRKVRRAEVRSSEGGGLASRTLPEAGAADGSDGRGSGGLAGGRSAEFEVSASRSPSYWRARR